jgi:hypothetical protein
LQFEQYARQSDVVWPVLKQFRHSWVVVVAVAGTVEDVDSAVEAECNAVAFTRTVDVGENIVEIVDI